MLTMRLPLTLIVVIGLAFPFAGCGEDEGNGPPTITQTRLGPRTDAEESPLGHVALRIEAWVDDPREDIALVYIAESTADLFIGDTAAKLPLDMRLQRTERRNGGEGGLEFEYWTLDFAVAAADLDGIAIVVAAEDTVDHLVTKRTMLAAESSGSTGVHRPVYMPLTVGNWWRYEDRKAGGSYTNRVSSTRETGGYTWYILNEGPNERLLRVTSRGDIITRYVFGDDTVYNQLLLDADRPVRKTWRAQSLLVSPFGGVSVEWTYYQIDSRHATIVTPAGQFTCLRVARSFDKSFDRNSASRWYADGVGRVRSTGVTSAFEPVDYVLVDYHVQ